MDVSPLLALPGDRLPSAAIFLSGSGSNAERVLEAMTGAGDRASFRVVALVTDAPVTSRAGEIGRAFSIPVIAEDIRAFYRERGEPRVTLATPRGRELREQWTDRLRQQLRPLAVDFGVLAGFVPLTNLTGDFPCLNVHPGDLTYLKDGQRYLVGLHTVPIERAILEGLDHLRSTVIQALPYTGRGDDMDNGPLLGISEPVAINFDGTGLDELRKIAAARPAVRPVGGYSDRLEEIARLNQDRLKREGDWVILPKTVAAFARGVYGRDAVGGLCYRIGTQWHPIETVVYGREEAEIRFRTAVGA